MRITDLTRRTFLGGLAGAASARAQQRPTNVIIILADDLGARDLGCYGSTFHETPNLDAFARTGVRFTQAYAACPVCSPTRASIVTGKYPARLHLTDWIPGRKQWPTAKLLTPQFEQQLPHDEITLAEALKAKGYVSASIGKWHLGGEGFLPTDQGFALNIGGTEKGSPPSYHAPFRIPGLKDEGYLTDNLTGRAEEFLEQNRDNPFFLYLPHFAVHTPLQAKREMVEKYQRKGKGQSDPIYAAMLQSLDEGVGRILRKLDSLAIAGHTAVFFLSDNGGLRFEGRRNIPVTNNAPLRAGKGHLYEGGIRIPLLVRWPGVTRAGLSGAVASTVDLMPTVLDLTGAGKPAMDGVSLAPAMRGGGVKRDAVYWHYPHYSNQGGVPGAAIRRGDWKLIEFYEDGRLELFNLRADPGEKRNLVNREKRRAADLHRLLRAWRDETKAAMPSVNPDYDAAKSDQGLAGVEKPSPPA
ncbi:MAG: sulfatase [Bryobacteraceae bacterium]|nr:sulfatase [Bryobacteraceae bacterium]